MYDKRYREYITKLSISQKITGEMKLMWMIADFSESHSSNFLKMRTYDKATKFSNHGLGTNQRNVPNFEIKIGDKSHN